MIVICGSLRCGFESLYKMIKNNREKRKEKKKEEIKIVPYLIFEPEKYSDYIRNSKRIAVILRKPDERAFSMWKKNLQDGIEWLDFERAIAYEQKRFYNLKEKQISWRYLYFRGGIYSEWLNKTKSVMGAKYFEQKVRIFPFEYIKNGEEKFLDFIGLSGVKMIHENKSILPAFPKFQFLITRIQQIAEEKIENELYRILITKMVLQIKNINIWIQNKFKINKLETDISTKATIDFIRYAYKDEIERLRYDHPSLSIWEKN
ncbi:MAG: hypothetical protein NZ927_05390 [Candidatus Calescibacterium sp.]|nr:hypothetical protein [Candidatus Calescibacterium sp.]MDW8086906.1 hypothetical protein [Candidatus Calescibacterium sp.]